MQDMLVDRLAAGIGGIECRQPLIAATDCVNPELSSHIK